MTGTQPIDRWVTPSRTIVSGAAGWLGRALVHRLAADPERSSLRLLVRDAAEAATLEGIDRSEVVIGDISDRAVVERLFDGCGADTDVVHTAGVIHPARVADFYRVKVIDTTQPELF